MVSEQPTRRVIAMLARAGWTVIRTRGSHSVWEGPRGTRITVPDGHRVISPGVMRAVLAALREDEAK